MGIGASPTGRCKPNRWGTRRSGRLHLNLFPVVAAFVQPDYLTLIRMLMNGGALNGVRILRPDTVALMGQNQIGLIDVGVLRTTVPAVSRDVDFFPGTKLKWGFGHMITTQPVPEGRSAGSFSHRSV